MKLSLEIKKAAEEYAMSTPMGLVWISPKDKRSFLAGAEHVLTTHVHIEDVMKLVAALEAIKTKETWNNLEVTDPDYFSHKIQHLQDIAIKALEEFRAKPGDKLETK